MAAHECSSRNTTVYSNISNLKLIASSKEDAKTAAGWCWRGPTANRVESFSGRQAANVTAILVVEGDPGICDFLTDALETDLLASVRCVNTGTLGAEAIDTGCFDIVIIDVGVSRISGYALAKRAIDRNMPALLSSGHPDALVKLQEYDLPHLAKPYRIGELLFAAATTIANSQKNIDHLKESLGKLLTATEETRTRLNRGVPHAGARFAEPSRL
jgi:DNA-binding response OmpR family regulator